MSVAKKAITEVSTDEISIAEARWQSIKAGLIGAVTVGLVSAIAYLIIFISSLPLPLPNTPLGWFVNLAVALCSGFFFGVTYRYIVRQDDNLHLGSGAVGAFAFVRSLAQIQSTWNDTFTPLFWLLLTGESFLWFAIARYTLDWAISRQIIEPLD